MYLWRKEKDRVQRAESPAPFALCTEKPDRDSLRLTKSKILPRCQNSLAAHFCPYGNLVGECLPQTLLCGLRRKNISVRQTGTAPEIPNRPAYFL